MTNETAMCPCVLMIVCGCWGRSTPGTGPVQWYKGLTNGREPRRSGCGLSKGDPRDIEGDLGLTSTAWGDCHPWSLSPLRQSEEVEGLSLRAQYCLLACLGSL